MTEPGEGFDAETRYGIARSRQFTQDVVEAMLDGDTDRATRMLEEAPRALLMGAVVDLTGHLETVARDHGEVDELRARLEQWTEAATSRYFRDVDEGR